MAPIFSNIFTVSLNAQTAQIVFKNQVAERAPIDTVAHVVVTTDNARELGQLLLKLADDVASGRVTKQSVQ